MRGAATQAAAPALTAEPVLDRQQPAQRLHLAVTSVLRHALLFLDSPSAAMTSLPPILPNQNHGETASPASLHPTVGALPSRVSSHPLCPVSMPASAALVQRENHLSLRLLNCAPSHFPVSPASHLSSFVLMESSFKNNNNNINSIIY